MEGGRGLAGQGARFRPEFPLHRVAGGQAGAEFGQCGPQLLTGIIDRGARGNGETLDQRAAAGLAEHEVLEHERGGALEADAAAIGFGDGGEFQGEGALRDLERLNQRLGPGERHGVQH